MTDTSHELALCIINDNTADYGTTYNQRLAIARQPRVTAQAMGWSSNARVAAARYVKKFGAKGDTAETVFTAADILLCAAELAEYYATHIAEIERLKTELATA